MRAEKQLKIYLDTSIPNHLFVDDKPDWMEDTWRLWARCVSGEYEIFLSDVFFEELNRCPQPKLGKMYKLLSFIDFER